MPWSKKLTQLNDILSDLVPYSEGITKYVNAAGLKPQYINTNGNALDIWNNVLSEADKRGKVDDLVRAVLNRYPDNPFLKSALGDKEIDYSLSPDIDKISEWYGVSADTLEVLTMGRSTLLPINFLEKGVQKSKAVGKVEIKTGTNSVKVGTGFLFRVKGIEELFFITNYHVINDSKDIDRTKIIFDYQLAVDDNTVQSKSFSIDKNGPWYCSAVHEYDATIFRLLDDNGVLAQYGYLELKEIKVCPNDFVNIIHHPGGEMKQISLYHNIVTNVNGRVVQYLTDTLKGSSGAPVFNSDWEVVALHHSGGSEKTGEASLPVGVKSRNEGVFINNIVHFVQGYYKK